MPLRSIGTRICNVRSLLRPQENSIHNYNKGLRAVLYGKRNNNGYNLGLIHLVTAARFKNELMQAKSLNGICNDSAITKMSGIAGSIPDKFKTAFSEIGYFDGVLKLPLIDKTAQLASSIRKSYDKFIDKPIARIRSKAYFGVHNVKDTLSGLFKKSKANDIDMAFVKQVFPSFVKIPKNASKEELKEFLIANLKKCNYTDKEIKAVLERKSPIFYRFVDETELRAVKMGKTMHSAADYNLDFNKTDVTTDPNYRAILNKYRITFKINPEWNPFKTGGSKRIESNDMTKKTWKLFGGYNKKDILCTERIR